MNSKDTVLPIWVFKKCKKATENATALSDTTRPSSPSPVCYEHVLHEHVLHELVAQDTSSVHIITLCPPSYIPSPKIS